MASQDNLMGENDDYQSRILASFAGQSQQNNARFSFNSNPFAAAMSAPVVTAVVTTVASIVTCVLPFNFAADDAPPPCVGRKRRDINEAEDAQFSILPSKTLKFLPTNFPLSSDMRQEKRLLPKIDQQTIHKSIISSKDDVAFGDMSKADQMNLREKRFVFNNNAMTSVSTSYVFARFCPDNFNATSELGSPSANRSMCWYQSSICCLLTSRLCHMYVGDSSLIMFTELNPLI